MDPRAGAGAGLDGSATNLPDGRVEVVAQGRREACERLLELLESSGTPGEVVAVGHWWTAPRALEPGFLPA